MASDLACDNRKMESASNAFPFMSLCANTYWKSQRRCRLLFLYIHAIVDVSDCEIRNLLESIIRHRDLYLSPIIFDLVSSCLFRTVTVRLPAQSQGSHWELCQSSVVHQCNFHKWHHQAPILSTSGAEWRRWEHYQMCLSSSRQHDPGGRYSYRVTFSAWLPDINASSPPYYHGNISQSIRLNKWLFSSASVSPPPSPFFSPSSAPAPLILPAPEPITRPPQGPGLHNRVSSWPSYSAELLNWYVFYITVGVLDSQMKVRTSVLVIDWKKLICAQLPFWDETLWFSEEMKLL